MTTIIFKPTFFVCFRAARNDHFWVHDGMEFKGPNIVFPSYLMFWLIYLASDYINIYAGNAILSHSIDSPGQPVSPCRALPLLRTEMSSSIKGVVINELSALEIVSLL